MSIDRAPAAEAAAAGRTRETGSCLLLHGGTIVTPQGTVEEGALLLTDGRIDRVDAAARIEAPPGARSIDCTGCLVLPGFIDTHFHGCQGDEVMDARVDSLERIARCLPRYGVTSFLPTTIAAADGEIHAVLDACAEARDRQQGGVPASRISGVHLEGPYINRAKKGAQPEEGIRDPDLAECARYLTRHPGLVKMMTFAPELPRAGDLIALLLDHGALPSMGHTDAYYWTAMAAIERGAVNATHLFNQMPSIHHRKPGLAVACLNDERVTVELITDGIHLNPAMIQLAWRCKGSGRVSLITDAIAALGMPEGEYRLGPHPVRVHDGMCTLADGTLAGSVHRMDRAFSQTRAYTGCSVEAASEMASAVPARSAGTADRKGKLATGFDADVVVLRDEAVWLTIVEGEIAWAADPVV